MHSIQQPIEMIEIPDRLRKGVNEETVTHLVESIRNIGLQTPITVRWVTDQDDGDHSILVTGRHRLEACRRLGIEFVDCVVFEGDEASARMWEIAENLHRADLTALERAEHVAEWVRLAEHNISATCADIPKRRGRPQSGVNAAVRDLGVERTAAQRSIKIDSLSPEAKEAAKSAGIDNNATKLMAASRLPAEQQVAEVKRLAEAKPVKPAPAPTNDIETEEAWLAAIMRVWNRGAPQWRERFLSTVDTPVFDRG